MIFNVPTLIDLFSTKNIYSGSKPNSGNKELSEVELYQITSGPLSCVSIGFVSTLSKMDLKFSQYDMAAVLQTLMTSKLQ